MATGIRLHHLSEPQSQRAGARKYRRHQHAVSALSAMLNFSGATTEDVINSWLRDYDTFAEYFC